MARVTRPAGAVRHYADLPAAPVQDHFARLRLIELLTGTHPYYLPEPLRLSERYGPDYAGFVFTLPEPMARYLDHRARYLLRHAGIDEPVTWEPPFDWVTGIAWPGRSAPSPRNPARRTRRRSGVRSAEQHPIA